MNALEASHKTHYVVLNVINNTIYSISFVKEFFIWGTHTQQDIRITL